MLWGSFEVRRLSTNTPRNCPNQLLLSQRCELEVNDYCRRMACEGLADFPIWEWGSYAVESHACAQNAQGWIGRQVFRLALIEQTFLFVDADVPPDIFKDSAGGYLREFLRLYLMQASAVYTAF